MRRRLSRATAQLIVALPLITGCAKQGFGDVEGSVTFNGKPLPAGLVTFTSEDDIWAANGYLKGDGTYAMPHVPAGPVRVAIQTDEFKGMMDEKVAADLRKRGLPAPEYDEKVKGFRYVKIPEKYGSRASSELKFEVKKDQMNRIDIDLK